MEIYDQQLCEKWAEAAQEPVVTPESPSAVPDNGPTQAELVQAFREYCADGNCRGRDGADPTPEDIAAAVIFLARSPAVTGQTIFVDAGANLEAFPRDFVYLGRE